MPCCRCLLTEWIGVRASRPWFLAVTIAGGYVLAPSVPIRSGANNGWSSSILRKKRLAASRSRLAVSRKSTGGAVLVDGAVQVAPLPTHLDVCLVDPDRAAVRPAEVPQSLLDQR